MIKIRNLGLIFVCAALSACSGPQATDAADSVNETEQIEIAEKFLEALAAEDADRAIAMLTEDAMVHAPFNPSGDASDDAIRSFPAAMYVTGATLTYDNLVFEDRKFSVADNGQTLWLEAEGRLRVAATDTAYHNRYVFKLDIEDGKISAITEYVNVATLAQTGVPAVAR